MKIIMLTFKSLRLAVCGICVTDTRMSCSRSKSLAYILYHDVSFNSQLLPSDLLMPQMEVT